MLLLKDLEKHLQKALKTFLQPKGFKKKADEFIRPSELGTNRLEPIITYYATEGSWIDFAVSVHVNQLDEVYRNFHQSYRGYVDDNYSPIIATLTEIKSIPNPYKGDIMALEDINIALESFYKDYNEHIESFLEYYSSIENIEKHVNNSYNLEEDGQFISPLFKAQTGIILANLIKRKDINDVFQGYVNSWKTSIDDEEQKKEQIEELEKLMEFLGYA